MPARIAIVHNLERPFLGHAAPALREAGVDLDERFPREGDPLPAPGEADGILVMGGEQNALEPSLAPQAALLREAVAQDVPVLGVCLGAQLLAHAHGGAVRRLQRRHLAWPELHALPAAEGDPVLGALPPGAAGVHWNEDGFALPPGAVELLRSPAGTGEGFRVGERAWGVQFHPELDEAALEHWYENWHHALGEAGVSEEAARAADREHLPRQRALSEAIFGGFARVVAAARG
ncbi:MAG TPA: type 1 glutamine amidotransferase [Solirubrobacteraceae bacterium]|nr:type 1 glutamine amidotransferase [Solirubrobacteraceae bacterium]